MIYGLLLTVQVAISIGLIAFVLIQHGKGADAGAAFGGGSSGTVFGSRGSANFLSRSTAVLATLFFLNSMGLAYLATDRSEPQSVIELIDTQAPSGQGTDDTLDVPAEPAGETSPQDIPR